MIHYKDAVALLLSSPNKYSKIVALDLGVRKVGIASALFAQQNPIPVCTLRAPIQLQNQDARDDFLSITLLGILQSLQPVTLIVCGYPFQTVTPFTKEGVRFASTIQRLVKSSSSIAPVLLWDETGSSASARQRLRSDKCELFNSINEKTRFDSLITRGIRMRQRSTRALPIGVRESVDEQSAVILLESFLKNVK
jgi:RNase H-fold protein (predicted Holliday junction resolvase)